MLYIYLIIFIFLNYYRCLYVNVMYNLVSVSVLVFRMYYSHVSRMSLINFVTIKGLPLLMMMSQSS